MPIIKVKIFSKEGGDILSYVKFSKMILSIDGFQDGHFVRLR
jgi:hypothetical protein